MEKILALKKKGYTIKQIAQEMDSTVGKVQYRLRKLQSQQHTSVLKKEKEFEANQVRPISDIPFSYELDRIVLLPQGPEALYIYWDLQSSTRHMVSHHFRKPWSELDKKLRVYDVTDLIFNGHNSHSNMDIILPEMTDNWFLNDLEANRTFIVDFGIQPHSSDFFTVLRSAPIETPRTESDSKRQDAVEKWKTGDCRSPEWFEQFSTYSIYSLLK
ncbi:DUF4912 domain-containing protein [Bacillus sp. Marseille-Q3570]|uniref:DUF4912 domain-containing protein n=1 Tax=Bacillus sp. Marseille-Q3570 TaxID=2963522 RepID=UPI0021B83FFF|nr:DUF4912 domain-containing protein [Bacillus sp. Marseille-Q3570]